MLRRDFWKNKRVIKMTASLFLLAVFLLCSVIGSGSGISYERTDPLDGEESDRTAAAEKEAGEPDGFEVTSVIFVDVIGCVNRPGVYQLEAGSRVFQAIELAGGLTEEAEIKSINRASVLRDEQVITVLSKEEYEKQRAMNGGTGFVDGKVDLNMADSRALESLSGIGPSMAERILEYRERSGGFRSAEELMNIDGIGEKTFQRLKDQICVQ